MSASIPQASELMSSLIYPWQHAAWQRLQQMRVRLPHAILFHGPHGIGKTAFAEHFAQSLLCEMPQTHGHACGQCASCNWFSQYNHPDYRRVRPEALEEDGSGEQEPMEAGEGGKAAKAGRAPSKEIRIDQVRALADFMNVSTHRHGNRVILLYPAETLNNAAANSLLKTLEEPPPETVFLLVSHAPHRLLPTIVSRCRKFALEMPSAPEAMEWMTAQGMSEPETWLAEQGGAPLAAYAASQAGSRENLDEFLQQLAQPSVDSALKAAQRLQKQAPVDVVIWLQRWLYDLFSAKFAGRIRYYPRYQNELTALAARADTFRLLQVLKGMNERRAIAEHPLSARLFIEDMLLDYSTVFA